MCVSLLFKRLAVLIEYLLMAFGVYFGNVFFVISFIYFHKINNSNRFLPFKNHFNILNFEIHCVFSYEMLSLFYRSSLSVSSMIVINEWWHCKLWINSLICIFYFIVSLACILLSCLSMVRSFKFFFGILWNFLLWFT